MARVNILKETVQNLTAAWVNLGPEIGTDGHNAIVLWLDIDINDTTNVRFRILAKHTSGGDEYVLPIKTETASVVNIADEYFEFVTDVDAKRVIGIALARIIPFIQVQIQAGAVGATPGQILDSKYTLS